ncbi:phage tail protein [Aeromicrobium endophyticum]|uniref:Phage tail protein n=1 Tax=Aeromicrobium endophyticum TaxID=2292704 RepID=A0A371PBR9_9ACTN|nr:tail fiber protein [Aeromicrobium endophyticum]REK72998.1 phage tail protein [Aeromicrobium endophyticum]
MSDPFVGEIRQVGFNFAPKGWAQCNGDLMPIFQNTALFSLLGTTYGGDGKSTFALPDLRGRFTLARGQGQGLSLYDLGQTGGEERVTLLTSEMPAHSHGVQASSASGDRESPADATWAQPRFGRVARQVYAADATTPMSPVASGAAGGGRPHNNMPPYVAVNFIIALQGVFPPRS